MFFGDIICPLLVHGGGLIFNYYLVSATVGSLQYHTLVRSAMTYAANQVCQHMHQLLTGYEARIKIFERNN